MEQYYIKDKNGRYKEAGYSMPDMYPGLYFHQKVKYGKRTTSVNYWLGEPKGEPVNLPLLIEILKNDDKLTKYIMELQDSDEALPKSSFKTGPLKILNWSVQELSVNILRFLYNELVDKESDSKDDV